jgi:Tfp pilus assembly protein PilO
MTGADLAALLKKHPIGAAALLVSLICAALIYFRGGAIAEKTQLGGEKTTEADKMQTNISAAANLAEQTATMQAATKEIETRLVRGNQLAINLQYFYKLEADTGVKILDVRQSGTSPARGAQKTVYTGIPFTVSVQGSFNQTMAFLKKLESGRHFNRIIQVTYAKSGGSDSSRSESAMTLAINLELLGLP